MVFLEDFDEFIAKSRELFDLDPINSRYTLKYRNIDRKATLKVTNNKKCYQYRCMDKNSNQLIDKFNVALLPSIANSIFSIGPSSKKKKGGKKGKAKKGKGKH